MTIIIYVLKSNDIKIYITFPKSLSNINANNISQLWHDNDHDGKIAWNNWRVFSQNRSLRDSILIPSLSHYANVRKFFNMYVNKESEM